MTDQPAASRLPKMPPEAAQDIALGLKAMAQSYTEVGMVREASRAERDSACWTAYAASVGDTPP